jgi:hypothetical protein
LGDPHGHGKIIVRQLGVDDLMADAASKGSPTVPQMDSHEGIVAPLAVSVNPSRLRNGSTGFWEFSGGDFFAWADFGFSSRHHSDANQERQTMEVLDSGFSKYSLMPTKAL